MGGLSAAELSEDVYPSGTSDATDHMSDQYLPTVTGKLGVTGRLMVPSSAVGDGETSSSLTSHASVLAMLMGEPESTEEWGRGTVTPASWRETDLGGPSVMVWGAINARFRSELVVINGNLTAQGYVNQVLQPTLLPLLDQHGGRNQLVFQHDNATPHSARFTRQFLQGNGVNVMPWPAMSPDMNCIEHVWDILGRRVNQHVPQPETREQLIDVLQHYWDTLPQRDILHLVMSMHRRLRACLAANGGHTRY